MEQKVSVSSDEIKNIIAAMEPAIGHFPELHVYVACITLCYMIMSDMMDLDDLSAAVAETSKFMSNYVKEHHTLINMPVSASEMN